MSPIDAMRKNCKNVTRLPAPGSCLKGKLELKSKPHIVGITTHFIISSKKTTFKQQPMNTPQMAKAAFKFISLR